MTMTTDKPRRLGAIHIAITTVVLASLGLFLTMSAGARGLSASAPGPIVTERPITAPSAPPQAAEAPPVPDIPPAGTTEPGFSAVDGSYADDTEKDDEGRETVRPGIRDEDSDDDSDDDEADEDDSSSEESSTGKPAEKEDAPDSDGD